MQVLAWFKSQGSVPDCKKKWLPLQLSKSAKALLGTAAPAQSALSNEISRVLDALKPPAGIFHKHVPNKGGDAFKNKSGCFKPFVITWMGAVVEVRIRFLHHGLHTIASRWGTSIYMCVHGNHSGWYIKGMHAGGSVSRGSHPERGTSRLEGATTGFRYRHQVGLGLVFSSTSKHRRVCSNMEPVALHIWPQRRILAECNEAERSIPASVMCNQTVHEIF